MKLELHQGWSPADTEGLCNVNLGLLKAYIDFAPDFNVHYFLSKLEELYRATVIEGRFRSLLVERVYLDILLSKNSPIEALRMRINNDNLPSILKQGLTAEEVKIRFNSTFRRLSF